MLTLALVTAVLLLVLSLWLTQPVFVGAGTQRPLASLPGRLRTHVEALARLAPRDIGHPANLDRAAEYIRDEFRKAGGNVSEQSFLVDLHEYRNVIARFGPKSEEMLLVGAHYDAFDDYPAADDNASGVAALIELAHLLGQAKLPIRVELVAYTLEEPPQFRGTQMGSAVHAADLAARGARLRAMLGLEMIGFFTDAPGSQAYPLPGLRLLYPDAGNFIAVVGNFIDAPLVRRVKKAMAAASDLPVRSINAPRWIPGVDFSDHLNYWENGYRAVMISDTAFYRNPNYHQPSDAPETLDYERMAKVVQQVFAAVRELAK
ncbi:MAG: M28 family peptidase [Acidobacteria bacterium]|nr:M28 family peptidase [Acidobacteriota bacterium]